jgi:hypothetical protein
MISGQNNGKNSGHAIEMLFFLRIQEEKLENDGKKLPKSIKSCGKSHENFSKTNGKRLGIAFLSSAQQ